jgi:hypothetical protein
MRLRTLVTDTFEDHQLNITNATNDWLWFAGIAPSPA